MDADQKLRIAAMTGNLEKSKLAVKEGANVNTKDTSGRTPLMSAASKGNKELVEFLVENNADINEKDNLGYNAFLHAVKGGDPNIENKKGKNALNAINKRMRKEIVDLLLKAGAKE